MSLIEADLRLGVLSLQLAHLERDFLLRAALAVEFRLELDLLQVLTRRGVEGGEHVILPFLLLDLMLRVFQRGLVHRERLVLEVHLPREHEEPGNLRVAHLRQLLFGQLEQRQVKPIRLGRLLVQLQLLLEVFQ